MQDVSIDRSIGLPPGLIYTALQKGPENQYTRFIVSSKRSLIRRSNLALKRRLICAPNRELKIIQRAIADFLSSKFAAHPIAHAYEANRSIFTNARQHVSARTILKIDLANFFGSIGIRPITSALIRLLPEFSNSDIRMLADLCSFEEVLPQGSPASPILSNLVCYPLDVQLADLARRYGCKVTRYSDDITFSTSAKFFPLSLARAWRCGPEFMVELGQPIYSLLERQGFEINASKLRLQTRPSRLKITGLIINDGVCVPREFSDNLRAGLHQWKTLGLYACADTHAHGCVVAFVNSLRGSIEYIAQAQGKHCDRYKRAMAAFEELRLRDRASLLAAAQNVKRR